MVPKGMMSLVSTIKLAQTRGYISHIYVCKLGVFHTYTFPREELLSVLLDGIKQYRYLFLLSWMDLFSQTVMSQIQTNSFLKLYRSIICIA